MTVPFVRRRGTIEVSLAENERELLRTLPDTLDALGPRDSDPAAARLNPPAYRDDAEASAHFHDMVDADLDRARAQDRRLMGDTVSATSLSDEEAQAWLRVIGEARLALGTRLGIEDESWEADGALARSQSGLLLQYLSYVQDSLVMVLMETL